MDKADVAAALEEAKAEQEQGADNAKQPTKTQTACLEALEATEKAAYAVTGEASAIAREAGRKKRRLEKPLPKYEQPVTPIMEELREPIALRCRELGVTFGYQTNKLWFVLLKSEGRIPADLEFHYRARRKQLFEKQEADIAKKDRTIEELQQQLAEAQGQTEDLGEGVKKIPC